MVFFGLAALLVAALVVVIAIKMGKKIGNVKALMEAWEKQNGPGQSEKPQDGPQDASLDALLDASLAPLIEPSVEEPEAGETPKAAASGDGRSFIPNDH